jgi:hypothetical protein
MALRTRPRVIGFFGSSRLTKRFGPRYFTRNLRGSQFARALLERAWQGYEEVTLPIKIDMWVLPRDLKGPRVESTDAFF